MIPPFQLIFWLFGSGHGLAAPFWDQRFFWLTQRRKRGSFYTFSHGFGAQLHSFQWFHPLPGERRFLCGRWFTVFSSRRSGPLVEVSWGMSRMSHDIMKANEQIRNLKEDLDNGYSEWGSVAPCAE